MKNFKILPLVSVVLLTAHLALAQTWTQTSAPITNWTAIACSADGGRLIAAANGGVGPGYTILPGPIYISTNSGTTWTQATNVPAATWCSVASSADGTKLLAAVSRGGIYRSVDSGLTWTQTSAPSNNWVSVTSSADGNKLAALARIFPGPDFYTSSDAGIPGSPMPCLMIAGWLWPLRQMETHWRLAVPARSWFRQIREAPGQQTSSMLRQLPHRQMAAGCWWLAAAGFTFQ